MKMDYKDYFAFLDDLRASGSINMFGAPKVLQDAFDIDKPTSMAIFKAWTETFNV